MKNNRRRKIAPVYFPVALCMAMSIGLYILRVLYTESTLFGFLIWNLFLAYIPFWASRKLIRAVSKNKSKWKIVLILFIWLGFLPNAPYMLTDLFHLLPSQEAPIWFDLMLILSFACTGFMLWILSVNIVHKLIAKTYGNQIGFISMSVIIILSGVGIYMGRYGRYNSWDLIFNPHGLFLDMMYRIVHPLSFPALYGLTFVFSLFLGISYYTIWFFGKRNFANNT